MFAINTIESYDGISHPVPPVHHICPRETAPLINVAVHSDENVLRVLIFCSPNRLWMSEKLSGPLRYKGIVNTIDEVKASSRERQAMAQSSAIRSRADHDQIAYMEQV